MSEDNETIVEDVRTVEERYRDSYRGTRTQRKVVEDDELNSIHPLESVPEHRDGSWTNGVLAWSRGATSTDYDVVGWGVVPRKRQKSSARKYRVKKSSSALDKMKADYQKSQKKVSKQERVDNRAKKSIRILRSRGYSMAEALMITRGQMGLDGKLIPVADDSEE